MDEIPQFVNEQRVYIPTASGMASRRNRCRSRRPPQRPPTHPGALGFWRAWLKNVRNMHKGWILVAGLYI